MGVFAARRLDAEKTDLQEGDVAGAREQLSKAEFQASILQNLLSKEARPVLTVPHASRMTAGIISC